MNNFVKKYQKYSNKRTIINISSGAGRRAVDAWSVYCASKSALDMISETIAKEQSFQSPEHQIKIFSIAPGVIDTHMQDQIRAVSADDFSTVEKFISLKENNELSSPEESASLIIKIIDQRNEFNEILLDVRDLFN